MELIAVLVPIAMLGVVLALGRYEELLLSPHEEANAEYATGRHMQPLGVPSLPEGATVEGAAGGRPGRG
ncbi:hypothetical protein OG735_38365 [Streptomyces sp. NBC_01210]|uniref:hypothetical protein n=1 Tax=Streptomyces sp. NBC_01210 TaxID=2903774 RepID=UPI002E121094|nr:hypothetical protein OG735_38365 [Streptomyces sp. NBC_01210]